MKKHINADFFKLIIAFLIICASLKPGLSDAAINTTKILTEKAAHNNISALFSSRSIQSFRHTQKNIKK